MAADARTKNEPPPTLERTSVNLTTPQLAWLREQSSQLGLTMGELLRRIVDKERANER